jgi:NADH:ubiquinone oxidoreductase subunit K
MERGRDKAGFESAEAAVGLAFIIAICRHYKTANVDEMNSLRG